MKLSKTLIVSVLGLGIGIGGGLTYSYISNDTVNATNSVKGKTISNFKEVSNGLHEGKKEIAKIKYKDKVKYPKNIPFDIDRNFTEVINFDEENNLKQLKKYYINDQNKSVLEYSVVDAEVIPSDEGIEIITLKNGESIFYFDNGIYQFIYFNKDGLSYEIKAKKNFDNDNVKFNVNELTKIVENL